MSVSYACLTSLKTLAQQYKQTGSSDTHYQPLLALLNKMCHSSHKLKECSDSDIILLLCGSTARIQNAPQFKGCVNQFLVDYQERNALQSFVNDKGNPVASDDFWKEENKAMLPEIPNAFTLELKAVIAERERRLRKSGDMVKPHEKKATFDLPQMK